MSRSVKSRRSIGAPSVRSTKTTLPPRFSSGMSIVSHTTERKSQLSLIQRSVPSAFHAKTIPPKEKAIRILENLGKRITKLNLSSDQQLNFCISLKQLQNLIDDPRESGFWSDWSTIKQSIISAVTDQSLKDPDFPNLKTFCDASFDQFSLGLGDISEKLPSQFETSKKSTEVQQRFTDLTESFKILRSKFDALNEESSPLQFKSVISSIQSFRQVLINDYKTVFSSLRNPEVKKRINETMRNPLLSIQQQNQIVRNLSSYLEHIQFRLSEFVDPKSAVASIKDLLQAVEMNLRKCVTDFPEEKRKQNYRERNALEEKQLSYNQLGAKLSELKRQKDKLTNDITILNSKESSIKEKINEEKESWLAEKKEFNKILKNPDYQSLIQKTSENLEKLKKQNAQIQDEISSRDSSDDINDIKDKAEKINRHLEISENQLFDLRSKNFTLIELLSDDQEAFKDNIPKFLDKWNSKIQLDVETELDFQMKQMNEKRSLIQLANEKITTKDFTSQIYKNKEKFEIIKKKLKNIVSLQRKIFKRKIRKLVDAASKEEYQKIESKLNLIDGIKEEKLSELDQMKAQAELLESEFNLSVLRNSQPQGSNARSSEEQQIIEQKDLNQRIIQNGNEIRLYLLKIQAKNNAMNYAIKNKGLGNGKISPLKIEKTKKEKSILKYKQELQLQENEIYEIEQMLNIKRDDDAVVEAIFAAILEKVKRLEENVDGDLDEKINEMMQNIALINRQKRNQS